MDVGYVQFAVFRSCGKGKLPMELAGVGVVSQLSPPELDPAPLLLLELLLEAPLELLLEEALEPPPLELLLLPEPLLALDAPLLLPELPPSVSLDGAPGGLVAVAQALAARNPMITEGRA